MSMALRRKRSTRQDRTGRNTRDAFYAAIKAKPGYKLGDVLKDTSAVEEDRTIDAAVKIFRRQLCEDPAGRLLVIHNEEYGSARNVAGLRWWLLGLTAACLATGGVGAWSGLTTTGESIQYFCWRNANEFRHRLGTL